MFRTAPARCRGDSICPYAISLKARSRHEEAKSLLLKVLPVAQRVLGESHDLTIRMRRTHAAALYEDDGATLDDLCEAVHMLEDSERTARCVIGGAHPVVVWIEEVLQNARAALRAREEPPSGA